jgi:hypothetical protein
LIDELFELQGRLMRELAGPEWDSFVDDDSSSECAGHLLQPETEADPPLRSD